LGLGPNLVGVDDWSDWSGTVLRGDVSRQVSYGMFNAERPPFDDPDARRAVAQCTDRVEFNDIVNPGMAAATGPFSPGVPGHLDDAGFPAHDPAAASAAVDAMGGLGFAYLTTNDPAEQLAAELLASMWAECGIDASIELQSQATVITRALLGDFDLVSWRNHGASDPTSEYVWWHSTNAEGLALNAGRIRDGVIDDALDGLRSTTDADLARDHAEVINRRMGEQVYNLWYDWSDWWVVARPELNDVGVLDLPDGGQARPKTHGDVWLTQVSLSDG